MSVQHYLQALCKSFCACIADLVSGKVEAFDGSVYLQTFDRKDRVSGATNQAQNSRKLVERIRNSVNEISLCLGPQRLRQWFEE